MRRPSWLRFSRDALVTAFTGPNGDKALKVLAKITGANQPSFDTDPLVMAFREGRREVWLRVCKAMQMTEEQIRSYEEIEPDE